MATNHFAVEVVSADRRLYSADAVSVMVPGVDGYFGVLRGHAPMVAALAVGVITITPADGSAPMLIAVSGGFVEVTADRVLILADAAELASEIDVERARIAKQRAEERLRAGGEDTDVERAQAALLRAINRLRAAERKAI